MTTPSRSGVRSMLGRAAGLGFAVMVAACAAGVSELRRTSAIGQYGWGPDRARMYLEVSGFDVTVPVSTESEIRVAAQRVTPGADGGGVRDVVHVTLLRGGRHFQIEVRAVRYGADRDGKWHPVDPEPLRGFVDSLAGWLPRGAGRPGAGSSASEPSAAAADRRYDPSLFRSQAPVRVAL